MSNDNVSLKGRKSSLTDNQKRSEITPLFFISIYHTMYRNAKPVERCQCCLQRVTLANPHSAADLFGDNNTTEVVDAADNTGSFHI